MKFQVLMIIKVLATERDFSMHFCEWKFIYEILVSYVNIVFLIHFYKQIV